MVAPSTSLITLMQVHKREKEWLRKPDLTLKGNEQNVYEDRLCLDYILDFFDICVNDIENDTGNTTTDHSCKPHTTLPTVMARSRCLVKGIKEQTYSDTFPDCSKLYLWVSWTKDSIFIFNSPFTIFSHGLVQGCLWNHIKSYHPQHSLNMCSLSKFSASALNWPLANFIWRFFTVVFWETVNNCLPLPALQHGWFQRPLSYPSFFSRLKFPDYFVVPNTKTMSHLSHSLSPYSVLFVSGTGIFQK